MSSTSHEKTRRLLSTPTRNPLLQLGSIESALYSWKHRFLFSHTTSAPSSLFVLLSKRLPHIEQESWHARAEFGGLYVNGIRATTDRTLHSDCIIEYFEPKYDFSQSAQFYPSLTPDLIVYEDSDLAIVYKPPGLPTQPNKEQHHHSLKTDLEKHFKRRVHLPSRLDTGTSGLIPVSLSPPMHKQLQRLFERRLVTKRYLCEVDSTLLDEPLRISAPIGRHPLHPVLRRVDSDTGDEAITDIDWLSPSHLIAKPITGRTHQIRVHLAEFIGPIVGDRFYGGRSANTLHLLCAELAFFHPIAQQYLSTTIPEQLLPEWAKEISIRKNCRRNTGMVEPIRK